MRGRAGGARKRSRTRWQCASEGTQAARQLNWRQGEWSRDGMATLGARFWGLGTNSRRDHAGCALCSIAKLYVCTVSAAEENLNRMKHAAWLVQLQDAVRMLGSVSQEEVHRTASRREDFRHLVTLEPQSLFEYLRARAMMHVANEKQPGGGKSVGLMFLLFSSG
nr:hypothetical protein CFP56_00179 [Quercus suber]